MYKSVQEDIFIVVISLYINFCGFVNAREGMSLKSIVSSEISGLVVATSKFCVSVLSKEAIIAQYSELNSELLRIVNVNFQP